MRRIKIALAAAMLAAVAVAAPASAITGTYVEDNVHTYVGLVVFYDDAGEFSHRCSGSLLSPTVFLTADEQAAFDASAAAVRELVDKLPA